MPCIESGIAPRTYRATNSALMAVSDHSSPVAQEPSGFEVAVRERGDRIAAAQRLKKQTAALRRETRREKFVKIFNSGIDLSFILAVTK